VLGDVLGRRGVGVERRLSSIAVVAIYVGLVVANFIWLWPILSGDPITPDRLTMETWLPSWG
jgi:dolichyl-phosphate-mannose--protein O-mannosyl transferase